MDLVSDLALMNASINASNSEQLSPSATTSTASTGIESFLSNSNTSLANCMLPQQDDASMGVNLDEKEDRPSLSYKDLIIEAIESSPEKRLKLSEIYQVIKYLHPYYRKRPDQWGWQNSIRHNLSLHDCFVKLPLKQSSASGVVGHFWTVIRDREEKTGSSRRRNRSSTTRLSRNGCKISNASAPASTSHIGKGKDRQSVSSDSGVMSDESQSSSPTSTQISDYASNPFLHNNPYGNIHLPSQLHRPLPSYTAPTPTILNSPTKSNGLMDNTNPSLLPLLGRIAMQSMLENNTAYANPQNSLASGLQRLQLLQLLYQQSLLQQFVDDQPSPTFTNPPSPVATLLTQLLLNNSNNSGMDIVGKMQSQPLLDLLLQTASLQSANTNTISTNFDPSSILSAAANAAPNLLEQQLRGTMNNVAINSPAPSAKDVVMI